MYGLHSYWWSLDLLFVSLYSWEILRKLWTHFSKTIIKMVLRDFGTSNLQQWKIQLNFLVTLAALFLPYMLDLRYPVSTSNQIIINWFNYLFLNVFIVILSNSFQPFFKKMQMCYWLFGNMWDCVWLCEITFFFVYSSPLLWFFTYGNDF